MKITFIGTAGSYLTVDKSYPAILINNDLLLDCGEGTTQKLLRLDVINNIKTICLTHLHNDHFLGLFSLLWYYWLSNRTDELELIGPPNMKNTVETILDLINTSKGMRSSFNLKFLELNDSNKIQTVRRKYNIKAIKVEHAILAYAYRIEENEKSICYSGDLSPSQNLIILAKNCDLFICESTFPNKFNTVAHQFGHSTPKDLASMALQSKSKKVVMVHIASLFIDQIDSFKEQAEKALNNDIIIAEDLMEIEI